MTTYQANQGDSTLVRNISVDAFPDISDANWVCVATVVTKLGTDTPLLTHTCPKDGTNAYFQSFWTPAQTQGLDVGEYYWIIQVSNITLTPQPFERQIKSKFIITPQGSTA